MKTPFVILSVLLTLSLNAQKLEIGAKLGLGASRINSGNLSQSFDFRNSLKSDIITWDVSQKWRFAFSIGGFAQYNFSEKFSALSELNIGSANSKIFIDYFEDNVDKNGDGDKETINSEAHIDFTTFSFPLMIYYNMGEKRPRFGAGLEFIFTGTPQIESIETKTKDIYKNFSLDKRDVETRAVTAKLDAFNSSYVNFIIGAGTTFKIAEKHFYIDLQYHLSISSMNMFTTDGNYYDITFKNNEVFSAVGKSEAEFKAPQHPLDDYKISFITISLRYTIFQK